MLAARRIVPEICVKPVRNCGDVLVSPFGFMLRNSSCVPDSVGCTENENGSKPRKPVPFRFTFSVVCGVLAEPDTCEVMLLAVVEPLFRFSVPVTAEVLVVPV